MREGGVRAGGRSEGGQEGGVREGGRDGGVRDREDNGYWQERVVRVRAGERGQQAILGARD